MQAESGLSVLFAAGERPSVDDIERLLSASPDTSAHGKGGAVASISSRRGMGQGWLELLASGLTFDLAGLAPSPAEALPRASHFFGLPRQETASALEAVTLYPGPHLAGGRAMLPVVRTMAAVASELAIRLGATAVCWQPAGSWMDPQYFARIIEGWRAGGAFPALGLTGIERTPDGGAESEGLAFFTGQELRVDPRRGEATAETVKLAVRVIDHLVRHGPVSGREQLTGPGGEALLAESSGDGRLVRVRREA